METKGGRMGRVLVTGRERETYTDTDTDTGTGTDTGTNTHRVRESGRERERNGRQYVRRNILGPFGILTIEIRRRRYHGELKVLVPAPKEAEVITSVREHHKPNVCV